MREPDEGLARLAPLARFVLQGGDAVREAAGGAFGIELPREACRGRAEGDRAALWLGPDEHLLLAEAGAAGSVATRLEAALQGLAHSLVDVGHRQVAMAVKGPRAHDLLASGCPLDLDISSFPIDACSRTLLAKAEVVLWRRGAEEYHLEVARSFADYVHEWLREVNRSDYP
jgi:sarcosine oxidase, subunit gamma